MDPVVIVVIAFIALYALALWKNREKRHWTRADWEAYDVQRGRKDPADAAPALMAAALRMAVDEERQAREGAIDRESIAEGERRVAARQAAKQEASAPVAPPAPGVDTDSAVASDGPDIWMLRAVRGGHTDRD